MNIFWGLPYLVWLAVCLLIAVIYFIFTPKEAMSVNASLAERFILKYAHATVWLLLALVCLLVNYQLTTTATIVAFTALFIYLLFIFTLIRVKIMQKK